MALYKGFSMFEYQKNKTFSLTDMEIVKMDLLNHIFTRKGERVMMPDFGTNIPDLVFEPMDNQTLSELETELLAVFDYDPRVEIIDFYMDPSYDTNTVSVYVKLVYIELNIQDVLNLSINLNQAA